MKIKKKTALKIKEQFMNPSEVFVFLQQHKLAKKIIKTIIAKMTKMIPNIMKAPVPFLKIVEPFLLFINSLNPLVSIPISTLYYSLRDFLPAPSTSILAINSGVHLFSVSAL